MKSIYSNKSNDIIGFIDIYHGYPNLQTLWISIFVLDRNIQNKGFGQEVIEALTKDAIDINYNKIGLAVRLKNWKALRFWTKAGFSKVIGIYGDKNFGQDTYALIELEKDIR
ncbi:GNAT family N-acetyltransferase [Clostridium sp. N37]|uniref:GNAT family N-acetyltransferase n=1 Tax=Clostridium faecium TaxID=2762223 RepID=A0ABR8YUD7_9CLOT|nr:GNAT family N-acetyltransferase [Clostridium faecium]MBD8047898.1 GNAT family N-acetyltransferase [Clostridium faecium]